MIELLKNDFKQAMINKNKAKKDIIQMIRGNIINLAKEKRIGENELTQEDILSVIVREVKQQNDSLLAFKEGNREDLVLETQNKIDILMNYLPKQLSEEEVKKEINKSIEDLNITEFTNKDKGLLMKEIMPKLKGKIDRAILSRLIMERF